MSSLWTPNDFSNILTVGAAALCSVLLVVFKSRCSDISLCWGLLACKRKPLNDEEVEEEEEPVIPPPRRSPRLAAAVPEPAVEGPDPPPP